MLQHVIRQCIWLLCAAMQLLVAMGLGVQWMIMSFRLLLFAVFNMRYILPQIWWYVVSPTVIRRVAYRSSALTKKKNLEKFFKKVEKTQMTESQVKKKFPMTAVFQAFSNEDIERKDVELLLSSLNPADGRPMSGLLPRSLTCGLGDQHDSPHALSLTDTIGLIEGLYAAQNASDRKPKAEAGEENPKRLNYSADLPDGSQFSEDDEEDEEDRLNLHNRATLDIYLPVPLDSLIHVTDPLKRKASHLKLCLKKFPIVICVCGGAWIIGHNIWNCFIARLLAARGFVVFCPDYRNFPQTNMEGMIFDVSDAIHWVLHNAERYNGDMHDVTLIGQSAGAHLCVMSLLSQARLHTPFAATTIPLPSTQVLYNPRASIHRFIGLSGIYNVRQLVHHLHKRGLYSHVLYQIAGGRANLPRYSPSYYFNSKDGLHADDPHAALIVDFLPRHMFFLHGDADCSAPVSESANITFLLRNAQHTRLCSQGIINNTTHITPQVSPINIGFFVVPDATHTDAILDECLSNATSHLISFFCDYNTNSVGNGLQRHYFSRMECCAEMDDVRESDAGDLLDMSPDGRLWSPVPRHRRPFLIRLASFVCPF